MPRKANALKAPADDNLPDRGAASQQRVVRTPTGAPVNVPRGAASSVFALAKAPGGKPATAKSPRTPLGPATVTVHRALPIPPRRNAAGASKWAAHWSALGVGDCAELADRQANSFAAWAKKQKFGFLLRRLTASAKGLWRTA